MKTISRLGSGLLLDRALLNIGDLLSSYTYLSGSIVFMIKLSSVSNPDSMLVESGLITLLNSRNIRLVTVEYATNVANFNMQRLTEQTDGYYYQVNSSGAMSSTLSSAISQINTIVQDNNYQNRRLSVSIRICYIYRLSHFTNFQFLYVSSSESIRYLSFRTLMFHPRFRWIQRVVT